MEMPHGWYDNSAVLCFCLCNSLHLPTVLTMFITLTSQSVEVPVDAHSSLTIQKHFSENTDSTITTYYIGAQEKKSVSLYKNCIIFHTVEVKET